MVSHAISIGKLLFGSEQNVSFAQKKFHCVKHHTRQLLRWVEWLAYENFNSAEVCEKKEVAVVCVNTRLCPETDAAGWHFVSEEVSHSKCGTIDTVSFITCFRLKNHLVLKNRLVPNACGIYEPFGFSYTCMIQTTQTSADMLCNSLWLKRISFQCGNALWWCSLVTREDLLSQWRWCAIWVSSLVKQKIVQNLDPSFPHWEGIEWTSMSMSNVDSSNNHTKGAINIFVTRPLPPSCMILRSTFIRLRCHSSNPQRILYSRSAPVSPKLFLTKDLWHLVLKLVWNLMRLCTKRAMVFFAVIFKIALISVARKITTWHRTAFAHVWLSCKSVVVTKPPYADDSRILHESVTCGGFFWGNLRTSLVPCRDCMWAFDLGLLRILCLAPPLWETRRAGSVQECGMQEFARSKRTSDLSRWRPIKGMKKRGCKKRQVQCKWHRLVIDVSRSLHLMCSFIHMWYPCVSLRHVTWWFVYTIHWA